MKRGLYVLSLSLLALLCIAACTPTDDDPGTDNVGGADTDPGNDGIQEPDNATDADVPGTEGTTDEWPEDLYPDVDQAQCTPGETADCYLGPNGSKGVGICKAGVSTCASSGNWGNCEGMVLPEPEICGNGIDENCDGVDGTEENTVDIDGDGYTYCTGDCCELESECLHPELVGPGGYDFVGNGVDDNCNGEIDEVVSCDTGLAEDSTDPVDMAKSIGLCPAGEDKDYGLVMAELLFPDGTTASQAFQVQGQDAQGNAVTIDCAATPPNPDSYAILPKFGNVITPKEGASFFMMSSGIADDPIPATALKPDNTSTEFMCTRSNAPIDWYQANGNEFPSSPGCGGLTGGDPGKEPLNDPVMLQLKVKVPVNARSFSVDIYFFSREFPEYVCQYNDFFVALLDSSFTSADPNLQNPADKNLAMDANKNPVGINLAKAGLFRACCNGPTAIACGYDMMNNYMSFCTLGPGELDGTGLYDADDKNGGTGWLVTKGNVVPGEEITLRLAIWDALDHVLDSEIVLDNFQWYPVEVKPGTGQE